MKYGKLTFSHPDVTYTYKGKNNGSHTHDFGIVKYDSLMQLGGTDANHTGVDDIEEYPDEHEEDVRLYNEAIAQLNAGDANRFPVRQEFYEAMDESFDPSKPMYRNDFDQFLNDKYGIDPDPFETGDFNW